MSKVYVPTYSNTNCAYIYSSDIIRVYDTVPQHSQTVNYTDYYIKSSYISNTGSTTFSQYSTLPTCISSSNITTDYWYRNDFSNILIILFIINFFVYWFGFRPIQRLFGRWLKW